MAIQQNGNNVLIDRMQMTSVLSDSELVAAPQNESDLTAIQQSEMDQVLGGIGPLTSTIVQSGAGTSINAATDFPIVLPNSPTFKVPNNPLLPPEYSEVLDYNSVQFMNGILRTQIGRYVRVKYLMGSNIMEDYDGFLIGVGINYIILQNYADNNIQILDFFGIKSVYVFYEDIARPVYADME